MIRMKKSGHTFVNNFLFKADMNLPRSLAAITLVLLMVLITCERTVVAGRHPSFAQVKDVAGLPRVLLIGDSISMQYTIPVRKLLDGTANVHRPARNCRSTRQTLAELDNYLGDGRWDIISFNWGIHDITHLNDVRKAVAPPEGKLQVPLDEYRQNVQTLVRRLKKTGAQLIWVSTTPIGQVAESKGYRRDRDVVAYNAAAAEVMKSEGVIINDLYAIVKPQAEKLLSDGVHFTPEGAATTAGVVADAIMRELKIQNLRQARKKAAHRKRRVIFDNDGNEVVYYCDTADAETLLKSRTTALLGKQVDTIAYCTWSSGFGYFTHNTRVGQIFDTKEQGFKNNKTAEFIEQGTDPLKIMVEFCRKNDIEIFWSMRMNDTHDAWGGWYSPLMFPQLKKDHPEWLVASKEKRAKHGGWSALDFNHKEIRDLAFKYIEEVCLNYDIDGVVLDYFRHPLYFKGPAWGKDATQEELDKLTEMMRRVRKMTERVGLQRGKPILVTVRVPDSVGYCKAMGIDIVRWLDEGLIDILAVSGYFRLNPWQTSVELGRKYDVPVYPCLSESRIRKQGASTKARQSIESYRARAANALSAGGDGVYIFNMFNPNHPIWNELGDGKALETMDKVYMAGVRGIRSVNRWFNNAEKRFMNRPHLSPERPRKLQQNKAFSIEINVGQKPSKDKQGKALAKVELQLRLAGLNNAEDITVKLNDTVLNAGVKKDDWFSYSVEPEVIKQGANKCEITLTSVSLAKAPVLKDMLLWVRYPSSI